jgi:GNAT superfamily N-acetyltransferase
MTCIMTTFNIALLTKMQAQNHAYHLLQQLNPSMLEEEFHSHLTHMWDIGNYHIAGIWNKDILIGLSGFWLGCKFYCGPYLEVDNLIIDQQYRNQHLGKLLMDWLTEYAKKQQCHSIILSSYVTNYPSHKFYYREGFSILGYHFSKKL